MRPDGPGDLHHVKISTAAKILNISPSTVRSWVDRGHVDFDQLGRGMDRYIPVTEIVRIAEKMRIVPDWDAAADDF